MMHDISVVSVDRPSVESLILRKGPYLDREYRGQARCSIPRLKHVITILNLSFRVFTLAIQNCKNIFTTIEAVL